MKTGNISGSHKAMVLLMIALLLWVFAAIYVFFIVPSDYQQGIMQRIFYYHVPTAWVSFLGFLMSFIYAIAYLKKRNLEYDIKSATYAVTGWIFTTGVMISGPLWAKPIWGDYWNWSDQRLVSFFILWLAFAGYILLRMGIPDLHKRARLSAVLSILAFIDVPLVFFAIRIWNTPSHPGAVVAAKKGSGLFHPDMKIAFFASLAAYTILFFAINFLIQTTLKQKARIEATTETNTQEQ